MANWPEWLLFLLLPDLAPLTQHQDSNPEKGFVSLSLEQMSGLLVFCLSNSYKQALKEVTRSIWEIASAEWCQHPSHMGQVWHF